MVVLLLCGNVGGLYMDDMENITQKYCHSPAASQAPAKFPSPAPSYPHNHYAYFIVPLHRVNQSIYHFFCNAFCLVVFLCQVDSFLFAVIVLIFLNSVFLILYARLVVPPIASISSISERIALVLAGLKLR